MFDINIDDKIRGVYNGATITAFDMVNWPLSKKLTPVLLVVLYLKLTIFSL